MLRRKKRLTLIVWVVLILSILCVAAATIAQINQMDVPVWLSSWAGWQCWGAGAMVAAAHAIALREKFRVRHVIALFVAIMVIVIGLSPL